MEAKWLWQLCWSTSSFGREDLHFMTLTKKNLTKDPFLPLVLSQFVVKLRHNVNFGYDIGITNIKKYRRDWSLETWRSESRRADPFVPFLEPPASLHRGLHEPLQDHSPRHTWKSLFQSVGKESSGSFGWNHPRETFGMRQSCLHVLYICLHVPSKSEKFKYFGVRFSSDGRHGNEIDDRVAKAFADLWELWRDFQIGSL